VINVGAKVSYKAPHNSYFAIPSCDKQRRGALLIRFVEVCTQLLDQALH
jgi:hypothetical protein